MLVKKQLAEVVIVASEALEIYAEFASLYGFNVGKPQDITINIDNEEMQTSSNLKHLDVWIDTHLRLGNHQNHLRIISSKAAKMQLPFGLARCL